MSLDFKSVQQTFEDFANTTIDENYLCSNFKAIYINIETTGPSKQDDDIIQIAAKYENNEFISYILPKCESINPINLLVSGTVIENEKMYVHGEKVECTTLEKSLENFLMFLEDVNKSFNNDKFVLFIAHNGLKFDFHFFIRDVIKYGFESHFNSTYFLDSFELIKKKLKLDSYNLLDLARYLNLEFEYSKNALSDTRNLVKILNQFKFNYEDLVGTWITLQTFINNNKIYKQLRINQKSLNLLGSHISYHNIQLLINAGITFEDIKIAHDNLSLEKLFEGINNSANIIDAVVAYFDASSCYSW